MIMPCLTQSDFNALTERVIGRAYVVGNALGGGLLEKCYENALAHELRKLGFDVVQQAPLQVMYDGIVVGEYFADILVNDELVIEVKAARAIDDAHVAQCLNYLTITRMKVGLVISFGRRVEIRRLVSEAFAQLPP